jgi:nucleotide-binding universal stress UspA family protein
MYNVLVPVDFSETSLNALKYAVGMFRSHPLKITVLHTYGTPSSAFHMKSLDRVLASDAEREMDRFIRKLEADEPNVLFKPVNIKGEAVHAISSMGDTGDYDLIVMGTKGASGLKEVFVGSVAGGVIAGTTAPVLVVPSGHVFEPMDKIVFALGDVSLSDNALVQPLLTLVEVLDCKVDILHITDEDEPDLSGKLGPLGDLDIEVHIGHGSGSVNDHLNNYLVNSHAKMLCLVRSKRDFFNRIFKASVTTKQTFDSPVPLLVLHS